MRKCLTLGLLLPALALGGCTLFGGGKTVDSTQLAPRRTTPLVIPSTFALPPPAEAPAPARSR